MEGIRRLLSQQLSLYPGMEFGDCVKVLYEQEMGQPELFGQRDFLLELEGELERFELPSAQPRRWENIGNGMCRVHLQGFEPGLTAATFAGICRRTGAMKPGNLEALDARLDVLPTLAREGALPYPPGEVEAFIDDYRSRGCPPLGHSARYRQLYAPHYRVVDTASALFLPAFAAIDRALAQKPHLLVVVDGMCGAGKSMLGALLRDVYRCGVVHTDDFFLRPEQRTPERLAETGGNIDYERLSPVARMAAEGDGFHYQAFDCVQDKMGILWQIPPGPLTVLEGVYALHPKVGAAADLKIFLTVDGDVQKYRVLTRSGSDLAARYFSQWIPMENAYFSAFAVRNGCDLVFDTTAL